MGGDQLAWGSKEQQMTPKLHVKHAMERHSF